MYKYILLLVLPFVIAEYDYDSCSVKCIEQWALSGKNVNTSIECLCSYQAANFVIEYNCCDSNDNCTLLIRREYNIIENHIEYGVYMIIIGIVLLSAIMLYFSVRMFGGLGVL